MNDSTMASDGTTQPPPPSTPTPRQLPQNNDLTAAEIMATMKPAVKPASVASRAKKQTANQHMNDSELVRSMAAELKRRGYSVAIQLKPEATAAILDRADGEDEESKPPASKKAKTTSPSRPLALPSFPFFPSTVTISQKNVNSWNATFEQLVTYRAENDGALPPADDPLGKWMKSQLTHYKRMRKDSKHNLSLDRISKLYSLNLECDKKPTRHESSQRDNEDGQLAMPALPALEPTAGKNAMKWQDRFAELRKYKEMHGDTNVPRSYDDSLSKWCSTQRLRCKEVMNGDAKATMTQTQFQALDALGFNMSQKRKHYDRTVIDKKWEDKFNELLQYKDKHGNCDVAVRKGFEEYKQLANWAGLQRRKWKAKQKGGTAGRTTSISDEQIKKLTSIGFTFSLQDDFDERFKSLVAFKKEHGHTKVPVFYTGYNNLGRWAKRWRDGIRNGESFVDDEKKTRLLSIDFDIAARRVFGKSNDTTGDGEIEGAVEPVEAQAVAALGSFQM